LKPFESKCVEITEDSGFKSDAPKRMGARGVKKFMFRSLETGCEQEVELLFMSRGRVTDKRKLKLKVGGPPKQVFDENVTIVNLNDLTKEADGTYTYSLPMEKQLGLRMRANPTTGFKWQQEIKSTDGGACFELSDSKYYMDKRGYTAPGGLS